MRSFFETGALLEYREVAARLERDFGLGSQFVDAVEQAVAAIERDPERYQLVEGGIRIFRVRRIPYCLFYDYCREEETVVIYAFAHQKKRT